MKYTEDKWAIEKFGLEQCRQMDAYYDNLLERKNNLVRKALSESNELAELIREKTGLKDLNFTFSHRTKRNSTEMLIDMESSEIKNPFIALAWKSFKIENFGGGCWARKNKEGNIKLRQIFQNLVQKLDIRWTSIFLMKAYPMAVMEFKLDVHIFLKVKDIGNLNWKKIENK